MSTQNQEGLNTLEGERGIPSVNEHEQSKATRVLVFLMLVIVIALAAGLGYWKYRNYVGKSKDTKKNENQITTSVPNRTFSEPPEKEMPHPEVVPPENEASAKPPVLISRQPTNSTASASGKTEPILDKSGSSLMINKETRPVNNQTNPGDKNTPNQKGDGLVTMLTSTKTPGTSATSIGNRNFMLAKGGFIPCALQTKLDSTVPGMTSCTVTSDIYSDNGKVLLIESGSTVEGEYKSNLGQGMARIFVLWSRIKTTQGIIATLESPGTDELGGAGLPGYVDNHFWDRFGSAILLTVISDAAQGASSYISSLNSQNGQNNQLNIGGLGSNNQAQTVATEALKNTINIPPTLYKNHGEIVYIYIARDLDFSGVYDIQ